MSVETAVVSHLKTGFQADANLSGLSVGVYPEIAPQSVAYPFVLVSVLSASIESTLNVKTLTLTESVIDLNVYAEKASDRSKILDSLKTLLHDHRGPMGTENLDVRRSLLESISTQSEGDITGSDEQIYRANLSINFFYNWS